MKTILRTLLIASAFILPMSAAYAGHDGKAAPKMEGMQMMCTPDKKCPMGDQAGDMQTRMGGMMSGMQGMMEQMKDPALKEKMQKMHEDMGAMMQHMQKMHEQMGQMPCMMEGKGSMGNAAKPAPGTAPATAPDADHEQHHPAQ